MKTITRVVLILAAVFIAAGICMIVVSLSFNAKPDRVLHNISNGDFDMDFRINSDIMPYKDDDFMDEIEDAFEEAGISGRKLRELMKKYNISESDIKRYMKRYNITPFALEQYLKIFGVNENNIDNFINSLLNGEF